jgi:hypothetical protein
MSHGILHYTKEGWVISYQTKQNQFGVVPYEIEKTIPLHPDDVNIVQASISQIVDNDGKEVDFEVVSETVQDKNVLYGKISKSFFR